MKNEQLVQIHAAGSWRLWIVGLLLVLVSGVILFKMVSLYTSEQAFLQKQAMPVLYVHV